MSEVAVINSAGGRKPTFIELCALNPVMIEHTNDARRLLERSGLVISGDALFNELGIVLHHEVEAAVAAEHVLIGHEGVVDLETVVDKQVNDCYIGCWHHLLHVQYDNLDDSIMAIVSPVVAAYRYAIPMVMAARRTNKGIWIAEFQLLKQRLAYDCAILGYRAAPDAGVLR